MNNKNRLESFLISIFTNLIFIVLILILILYSPYFQKFIKNNDSPNTEKTKETVKVINNEDQAVIDVVKNSQDAVVSIIVSKDLPLLESQDFFDPFFDDPFFQHFFHIQRPNRKNDEDKKIKKEIGGGSGFIISEDGLIVTNKHVVFDPDAEYTVLLNNGKKYEAEVLDKDILNDIAILKIKNLPKDIKLKTLELGDSDKLEVGQTVIAIGNALGEYRNTVSKGIIAGLKRDITAGDGFGRAEELNDLIQTDAAINQGNSGGPLLDLNGKVIGINVAMAQGAENIGFAIAINDIKNIIENVKKNGKIVRPYLGIRYIPITKEIQEKNNLPYDYGALILRGPDRSDLAIIPGSPADKAGLEEYDIILEVNGQKINKDHPLFKEILKYQVGDTIKLKIYHDGKEKDLNIKLEERKIKE